MMVFSDHKYIRQTSRTKLLCVSSDLRKFGCLCSAFCFNFCFSASDSIKFNLKLWEKLLSQSFILHNKTPYEILIKYLQDENWMEITEAITIWCTSHIVLWYTQNKKEPVAGIPLPTLFDWANFIYKQSNICCIYHATHGESKKKLFFQTTTIP